MQRSNVWSASAMIGERVYNAAGENLGKIEDLVIDPHTGSSLYAVLSFGGFIGVGDKWFAIPWESLSVSPTDGHLILEVDKETLRRAPGFDRTTWPDMSDPDWQRRTYEYYGRPYVAGVRQRPSRYADIEPNRSSWQTRPARTISGATAALLILVLVGVLAFAFLISTRGWDQSRNDVVNSARGVAYAMKETSQDAALTAKVQTAFSLSKRIPSDARINVDSRDGIVTLRGEVTSGNLRSEAERIASDTPGVQAVQNHLYVVGSPNR